MEIQGGGDHLLVLAELRRLGCTMDAPQATRPSYDAILLVSFGGPEAHDDVLPFLENVVRGRRVPPERLLKVAEHYYHFDGKSPINDQNRALIAALGAELQRHNVELPVYWGNRNWHPMLPDTIRQMRDDGVNHALAFVTSAFSSYSGCRQYRENIAAARQEVGESAPQIDKLRVFYNHPGFIEAVAEHLGRAIADLPPAAAHERCIAFTAHSLPMSMAEHCDYVVQLREACALVADRLGLARWDLVFQSRSGPPEQPWLGPDILDYVAALPSRGVRQLAVAPIGFVSDHMEILWDLDVESKEACDRLQIRMVRASTAGTHASFVAMIRELIAERISGAAKRSMGQRGPSHDLCPIDCCQPVAMPLAGRPRPA